jgi:GNAT superfamily N-acetyltransferase
MSGTRAPAGLRICKADYRLATHASAVVTLLNSYALDPMGGGVALSEAVKAGLVAAFATRPTIFSVLAFEGETDANPIGLANCIEGFSSFACRPLVNVHDLVVHPDYRGLGVAHAMLDLVEQLARERGACKITLEVLSGNARAMALYKQLGFLNYVLDPAKGDARLMQKSLD